MDEIELDELAEAPGRAARGRRSEASPGGGNGWRGTSGAPRKQRVEAAGTRVRSFAIPTCGGRTWRATWRLDRLW